MAVSLGDVLQLSSSGTSRVSCTCSTVANVAVPAVGKHVGDQYRPIPRLAGCRTILGGLPSSEICVVLNGSRKMVSAFRAAQSESVDAAKPESESKPSPSPSTSNGSQGQSHLDLLERMTEKVTASQGNGVVTIRDRLASQVEPEASEVVVSLAKGEKDAPVADLTISQKRNIRRQNYLNKVSERNDAPFFAIVAGFVLVPPILILGFAIATGYVELFP